MRMGKDVRTSWLVWDQRSTIQRAYQGTRPSWPQCRRPRRSKRRRRSCFSGERSGRFRVAEIGVWIRNLGGAGPDIGNDATERDRPRGRSRR